MSPNSRRIFLYWILLLVPTLAVGAGAILLLRREQLRVAQQGAYADAARRTAVLARAQLIVENVELLVGEVKTGLLDTLAAEPAAGLDAFLAQWEQTNPLVRTAFRARADGRLLRPAARTADEDARGFVRRFERQFGGHPPWALPAPGTPAAEERKPVGSAAEESATRQDATRNVAQVQSARRNVQELFKSQNAANNALADSSVPAAPLADAAPSPAGATRSGMRETERMAAGESAGVTSSRARLATRSPSPGTAATPAPAMPASKHELAPERRGWLPLTMEGRLHLFGWVQPGGAGEVRGVEVDLGALMSRLGGALPAETAVGEGYALRDEQGRVLHQVGAVGPGGPAVRVPFALALLPGWDVAAFLLQDSAPAGAGHAFLGLSLLLVALFVAAILAGGSLLLREARRSEAEAAQKTSFVANVSHEFKTPLTTIRLYAELLEQGRVRDAEQGNDYLRTIGRETQRLARLVNNALDFSRLEQGRKKYATESVDLVAEINRLIDTHAPRVAEAGLVLRCELPVSPLWVTTDRDAIGQIVLNLIDNACKYAAEGGEVVVTVAARATGGAEVRVSDRGPGVPPEHRERIFEKFHRVDDALTAEKGGAGLGLSIARRLARGLGGELRYRARSGAGAEFVLELP